jgi:hypothetical protein
MDLGAITDGKGEEESVNAILRWLTNKRDRPWLLFFDNADDVDLKLEEFIPPSGNILVTTRNPELRLLADEGSYENVTSMGHEDAIDLLLQLSRADDTVGSRVLAVQIVQVFLSFLWSKKGCQTARYRNSNTSLWRFLRRVPSFTAIRRYATIATSTDVHATICYRRKKLEIWTHTN